MTDLLQAHAVADAERYLALARGVLDIEADAVRALTHKLIPPDAPDCFTPSHP